MFYVIVFILIQTLLLWSAIGNFNQVFGSKVEICLDLIIKIKRGFGDFFSYYFFKGQYEINNKLLLECGINVVKGLIGLMLDLSLWI
jgi:hypothetical protein